MDGGEDCFLLLAAGLLAAAGVTATALEDMVGFVVITAAMVAIVQRACCDEAAVVRVVHVVCVGKKWRWAANPKHRMKKDPTSTFFVTI